jgi:hypothetical protein
MATPFRYKTDCTLLPCSHPVREERERRERGSPRKEKKEGKEKKGNF